MLSVEFSDQLRSKLGNVFALRLFLFFFLFLLFAAAVKGGGILCIWEFINLFSLRSHCV